MNNALQNLTDYMNASRGSPDVRVLWVDNGGDGTGAWYVELHGEPIGDDHPHLETALGLALDEWKRWEEDGELP